MNLTFLGTGGGRFTMIKQLRRTGGMHLSHSMNSENSLDRANASSSSSEDFSLYIDPGPGALVYALEEGIELEKLDAIIVTHAHLDHCNDMNVLIEAMTSGGDKDTGTLLANRTVIDGADLPDKYVEGEGTYGTSIDPVLDGFHRGLVADTVMLEDETETEVGPFTMECLGMEHSDPHTIGFTLATDDKKVGFTSDTELFDEMEDFFGDCDVLVLNVMRPLEHDWKGHLTTEDAADLVNAVEPELAILQQFGSLFIYESVNDQEAWLEDHIDVEFIMAEDGMTINLENPKQGLERFLSDE